MDLSKIVKVGDYDRVIRTLKNDTEFGIHGIPYERLMEIWEGKRPEGNCIGAHYFAVTNEEQKLPDRQFYEKLWASVEISLGYSLRDNWPIIKGKPAFSTIPCLLIGIDTKQRPYPERKVIGVNSEYTRSSNIYHDEGGKFARTFPIGHGFFLDCGIKLFSGIINEKELETIANQVERYGKRMAPCSDVALALLTKRELIKRGIRKVYDAVASYQHSS